MMFSKEMQMIAKRSGLVSLGAVVLGAGKGAAEGRLDAEHRKEIRGHVQGFEPLGTTPDEFAGFTRAEMEKYARVVKTANVKVE